MSKGKTLYSFIDFAMEKKKQTALEMVKKLKEMSEIYDKN